MRRSVYRIATVALVAGVLMSSTAPSAVMAAPQEGGSVTSGITGIHNDDGRLVDASGRTVVLRGLNIVDKQGWTGELARPMLDDSAVAQLAAVGFNHVRFGTTWDSIEHERGQFDDAYVDQFIDQLDLLARHGIAAVVDVHQDLWSEQRGGDGAPAWADPQCNTLPDANLDDATGQWFLEYGSPAVTAAFANFWYDGYGDADLHCTGPIQTEFVEMWGYLASRLGGHPAVIGYDILNEPWPGTTPPGVFEQTQLMPMYQRVAAAIREYDRKTPIFFEPVAIYTNSIPTMGEAPDPNAVFAPHIYTEALATNGDVTFGGLSEETTLSKVQADAQRMGVPMWIGEWGAIDSPSYITRTYDLFDRYGTGAAFWDDVQYPGRRFAEDHEPPHVRPYPELYPGTATWSYDASTTAFTMTVTTDRSGQVQLVVPPRLGLASIATTGGAVRFSGQNRHATTCSAKAESPCRAVWELPSAGTFRLTLRTPGQPM